MRESDYEPVAQWVQTGGLNKGRIVIYRGVPRRPGEGIGERPAIVQRVYGPWYGDKVVDLYPFFTDSPHTTVRRVPYSLPVEPNTWCWCDEQDLSTEGQEA